MSDSFPLAKRVSYIQPFYVMDILAQAKALEAQGRNIIHLEIGEPDFSSPATIVKAGQQAMEQGLTHYTPAMGITPLREAIAAAYGRDHGVNIPWRHIAVTTGASGALILLFALTIDAGDEVILSDPGYPCYRHFARLFDGVPVNVPVDADSGYQLTAALIEKNWRARTKVVILSSPSNPTGTVVDPGELSRIIQTVNQLGGVLVVDEIYQGLLYGSQPSTALSLSRDLVVINSFSKYYGMTGWRLGWTVLPEFMASAFDKMAQNFFLSPPTASQYAAMVAFDSETRRELERRRLELQARRDYLLPRLQDMGFNIAVEPQGAFYIYADCSAFTDDSQQFCSDLLTHAGVAITPGRDFGDYQHRRYIRIAYTQPVEKLKQAVERIKAYTNT